MDDAKYIHHLKLSEQAEVYVQERNNLESLKTQIIRTKHMSDGTKQSRYELLIRQVEQMIHFMDAMSKAAGSTAESAAEISRQINVMSQDILFENQKIFSNAFKES